MVGITCDRMDRPNQRSSSGFLLLCFGLFAALCAAVAGCGGGPQTVPAPPAPPPATPPTTPQVLTESDVMALVEAAATAAQSDTMAIAVVDRLGRILAVYEGPAGPALVPGNFGAMVPPGERAGLL